MQKQNPEKADNENGRKFSDVGNFQKQMCSIYEIQS